MRTKNTIINSAVGFLMEFLLLIFAFATRKSFLNILGTEYLGYDSLFSSILSVLSIMDLGLLSAMHVALYKPVHDGDFVAINVLVSFFKKIFYGIGCLFIVISVLIVPLLPYLVNGGIDNQKYFSVIFLMYALNSFLSYFFVHIRAMLFVNQKEYIVLTVDAITRILVKVLQIVLLNIYPSYIYYLGLEIVLSLIANFALNYYGNKKFDYLNKTNIKLSDESRKKIYKNVMDLGIIKIASVGIQSMDSMIISKMIGISTMALYGNYQLISASAAGLLSRIYSGINASFASLYIENDKNKIYSIINTSLFLSFLISAVYVCFMGSLIQPFISLLFGSQYLIDFRIIIVLILNHMLSLMYAYSVTIFNISGNFKKMKPISLLEFVLNLIISMLLVKDFGLLGVLIGTLISRICAVFLRVLLVIDSEKINYKGRFLFKNLFFFILALLECILCIILNNIIFTEFTLLNFVFRAIVTALYVVFINFCLFYKTKEFRKLYSILMEMVKNRK